MALADAIRGAYVRSPSSVRRMLGPIVAALPVSLRYGRTYATFRRYIARSECEAEFVERFRLERLRRLLALSRSRSDYYRELLSRTYGSELDLDSFRIEDLSSLPVLLKSDMRERIDELLAAPREQMDLVTTGGSSGAPVVFYLDKDRSPKEWAFVTHIWSRIGYRPGDCRAVLRGVHIERAEERPWEFDPALNELRLSPFHLVPETMDEYLELIDKHRARFIHGYPSAIEILLSHAASKAWKPPSTLAGILPISETLFESQRALFGRVLGDRPVMPFYGVSEKVAIAGEVPGSPDVYEFEPLYGIADLVDEDGKSLSERGQRGRLIGTGLLSIGMPLIRYYTGDRAVLVEPAKRENAYRLRVREIRSRWDQELLVGKNGAQISAAAINIHSEAFRSVVAFQFRQERAGQADVLVIAREGSTIDDIAPFVREMQHKVGANLILNLKTVGELERTPRGKRPLVVTQMDDRPRQGPGSAP